MSNARRFGVAMCLAVLATAALGQQPPDRGKKRDDRSKSDKEPPPPVIRAIIGERAPELYAGAWLNTEGTPTLDRFKNRIIVLFFFRTDDSSADTIAPVGELHKKLAGSGVVVIGLTPQKKDAAESAVKGKQVKFAVGYEAQTEARYQVGSFPTVFLIDPSGTLVNRFHPDDDLEGKVRGQIARTPPSGADAGALKKRFESAKAAVKDKEYGRAYTLAKDVASVAEANSALSKAAAELLKQIDTSAKKWLEEAKELLKKEDTAKACHILAELSVRFVGESLATDAETEIGKFMGDLKVKPVLRKEIDEGKARLLLDQATDHEAAERYPETMEVYRQVAEQYPDTETRKLADAALDRIAGDEKAKEAVAKRRAEEEADRWLDLGERFSRVAMYDEAKEYYERVLAQHPKSRAAARAKDLLKKLPEPEPEEEPPAAGDEEAAEEA